MPPSGRSKSLMGSPITTQNLREAIERGDAPLVVDTRSRWEYARDRVPGAVHLPFWRVAARHRELNAEPDTPMVVYCGYGPRAMWARRTLERLGYERTSLLRGHWFRWRRTV